jgi:hypothetical protein
MPHTIRTSPSRAPLRGSPIGLCQRNRCELLVRHLLPAARARRCLTPSFREAGLPFEHHPTKLFRGVSTLILLPSLSLISVALRS